MATGTTRGQYGRSVTAKPRNDAYTGLLVLSFLAMVASCVLLYIDYGTYDKSAPPAVKQALSAAQTPQGVGVPPVDPASSTTPKEDEPKKEEPKKEEPPKS